MLGGAGPWQFLALVAIIYLNLKDSGLWTANAVKQGAQVGSGMTDEFQEAAVSSVGISSPVSDGDLPKLSRRKSLQSRQSVHPRNVHIMFCQS